MLEKSNKDKSHSKINNNLKEQQPKMEKPSLESSEKQKKTHRKRKPDSERDKQKAELERSGNELKKLLAQFGTKAKVADDIDKDTTALRDSIVELMTKAKSKSINNNTKPGNDAAPHSHRQSENTTTTTSTSLATSFYIIWNNLMSFVALIINPFQSLYQSYEKLYHSHLLLISVLLLELSIIGLIWKFKRTQYIYMYEPYEPVVHGTFGVEKTFWLYIKSIVDIMFDFFSEVKYGGRSFASSNYDGLVPI